MLVPKLRFKREDGTDYPEWNKDKWLSLGNFVSSGTLSKSDLSDTGTPCILYGELYTKYGEVAHTIYSKTSAEVHTFSQADDVILPKSGETPEDISTATCIPFDSISLGGDLIVFRHNEKVIGRYLSYLISNRTKNAIASIAQGKSVVHINEKSLSNIVLPYPVIEEQQKIADFLSALDEVIIQSEAEVRNLEQQKKSAMQKIFSQELRFKREDGTEYPEWEEKKFGTTVLIERGGSPRPIKQYITNGDGYNWVKIGDAPEHGNYITHTEEKIKKSGLNKTRQVFKGDLILSNSMSFGKPYIMAIDGCIHDGWLLIRNNQNIYNLKFLCYLLGTDYMLKQYKSLAGGSTVNNLNKELVSMTTVSVPCLEEQQKIADFLSALDETISYAKQEFDKWKELKKGLLQQMFV